MKHQGMRNGMGFVGLLLSLVYAPGVSLTASGAELLRNGDFSEGLAHWGVPAILQGWNPLQGDGSVGLDKLDYSYLGPVLQQNLSWAGAAEQVLHFSVEARANWAWGDEAILVFDVVFTRTGGAMGSARLLALNATDLTEEWSPFVGSATLPGDAERVIRLKLIQTSQQTLFFRNLSLTSTGLVAGELPELEAVRPYVAAYGQTIRLTGTGFGAVPGEILLAGRLGGFSISSWSDSEIEAELDAPGETGFVVVRRADQTESSELRGLYVTSPHFSVRAPRTFIQGLAGAVMDIPFYIQASNGFSPAHGYVLTSPGNESRATFIGALGSASGGAVLQLETVGMGAGNHTVMLTAADGSGAPHTLEVELHLKALDRIDLFLGPAFWDRELVESDEITISRQQVLEAYVELFGPDDAPLGPEAGGWYLEWTSSNPSVLEIYRDNWGGVSLLPQENGTCDLAISGPGGFVRTLAVTVNLPAEPKVTGIGFSANPVYNDGETEYTFSFSTNSHTLAWGITGLWVADTRTDWGTSSAVLSFTLHPGEAPGAAIFTAACGPSDGRVVRGRVLHIANHPSRAQFGGRIYLLNEADQHHVSGRFDFFDPVSGELLFERELFGYGNDYVLSYLPPGEYLVRFQPESWEMDYAPLWYPGVDSMADAHVLDLNAGDNREGLHWFFLPPAGKPPPPPPAPVSSVGGVVNLEMPTEPGVWYVVEVSDTLYPDSWSVLLEFVGDGETKNISDNLTAAGKRFYRILAL